ncbi:oligosaccharide flippase family protein [bacterium]|nr:oligosaccharide flippase family protein [bacterium]
MTGGGVLARNALWNLTGLAVPIVVAILCIPVIVNRLGAEKFGVLNLAWMVIGYFTLFDLGLGRALTKLVAEKLGHERQDDLPSLIWTASLMMTVLGILGAVVLALLTPYLVNHIFKVPNGIRQETTRTFYLLAVAVPLVISTTGLRGILEAHQRFDLSSALRASMGTFMFLGPLLVLPFSRNLFWITFVLVTGRIVAWGFYLLFCFRVLPGLRAHISPKLDMVRPLLAFGGWMTVSNVISPLMTYLDRFLIGAMISMAAVAYYSTPWEIVTKFLVIPGAVVGVMFPAFSATYVQDRFRASQLYRRSLKYVFLSLFPLTLLVASFAKEGINLWLGAEFAVNGFRVMQLLAIGVLMNGIASIPFAFIQGVGRPDVTAKFHLAEAAVYLPSAWLLIRGYGVTGAALAWMLRAGVDALLLLLFADRLLGMESARDARPAISWLLIAAVLILIVALSPVTIRIPLVGIVLTILALAMWYRGFDMDEKSYFNEKMGSIFKLLHSRR